MYWFVAAFVLGSLAAGCVRASPGSAADSITVYAAGASGNVAPTRSISGSRTGLHFPSAIVVGRHGNICVANRASNSITCYAASANGDAAPVRTIHGPLTGLNVPTGVAFDPAGNVYVANRSSNDIVVYGPNANGNVAPMRRIAGAATRLDGPTSVAGDGAGTVLVANLAGRRLTVYASGATGNVVPIRTIAGPRTGLTDPYGVAVDRPGATYVVNSGSDRRSAITSYAKDARGDVAPATTIGGAGAALGSASGVGIDGAGEVYVSDHGGKTAPGALVVFAPGASGNAKPTRVIRGDRTRLAPFGLFVDSAGVIYAVNHQQ